MSLPFDGAISAYFQEGAPKGIRKAIDDAGKILTACPCFCAVRAQWCADAQASNAISPGSWFAMKSANFLRLSGLLERSRPRGVTTDTWITFFARSTPIVCSCRPMCGFLFVLW